MIDWITQMVLEADIVFLLILFFSERNSPSKILLWALVFFAMPIVGFIVYIFIGQTFYSDQKFKDKSIRDAALLARKEDKTDSEPDPEYRRTAKAILNLGGVGFSDNNDVKLYTLGRRSSRTSTPTSGTRRSTSTSNTTSSGTTSSGTS